MKRPHTLLKSCVRQLARMVQNAASHQYRIYSLCKTLKESPDRLWKLCQDALGKTPREVMDWVRAKAFIEALRANPNVKLRQLRRELGYESESAFNAFAYRVFGCAPQEAKTHLEQAERRMQANYAVIEACLASAKPKPKRKTETENRNGKPKRKTETENRKRFFL
ncbi:MAG: helix-turn-helix domain-containing protein, partial [Chloroherpetonaceae bacterium]